MKKLSILLFPLLILACSTPYQPRGLMGGYTDEHLGNDIFLITVRVNAYTDEATAYEYFHRRANEIVRQYGYTGYEVLELGTSDKSGLYYIGERPYTFKKPRVYGRIKCYWN